LLEHRKHLFHRKALPFYGFFSFPSPGDFATQLASLLAKKLRCQSHLRMIDMKESQFSKEQNLRILKAAETMATEVAVRQHGFSEPSIYR
jgi:imidazolonepropionase-like amidohydrolase